MDRNKKIETLKGISHGTKSVSDLHEPDITKYTVEELYKLLRIQERVFKDGKKDLSVLTKEDVLFMENLKKVEKERPIDYGRMMQQKQKVYA